MPPEFNLLRPSVCLIRISDSAQVSLSGFLARPCLTQFKGDLTGRELKLEVIRAW
jgi:hypothetical protein